MALAKPSIEQQAFINAAKRGDNIVVVACAGSGKTTASLNLLWQVAEMYPNKRLLYVAFQNEVTTDIKKKIKENIPSSIANQIDVRTSYSLGYELLKEHYTSELDVNGKVSSLVSWKLGEVYKRYGGKTSDRAVSVYGEFSETKRLLVQLYNIAQTRQVFDVPGLARIEHERMLFPFPATEELFQVVIDAIAESKKWLTHGNWDGKKVHDFTDMVAIAARMGFKSQTKYDVILIDEAQDVGEAQVKVIEAFSDTQTQWVVVGDPMQNIFGFAGAIHNRMDLLKAKYNATQYSMPLSYRASQVVAKLAQEYVPDFRCLPTAPKGFIGNISASKAIDKMQEGDIVLARTIAQLLEVAIIALTTGKKVTFLGGNLKLQIKAALDDIKARFGFKDFKHSVELYVRESIEFLITKHGDTNIDELRKEIELMGSGLISLYNFACSGGCTDANFEAFVYELFVGDNEKKGKRTPSIRFLTGHRGKGLEAGRIFIIQPPNGNLPYSNTKMSQQLQKEEIHLYYVMVTRSSHTVWFVVPDTADSTTELIGGTKEPQPATNIQEALNSGERAEEFRIEEEIESIKKVLAIQRQLW